MCLKKAASYGYDATTLAWDWSDALTYRARSFRPDAQLAHQRTPLRLLLADVAGLPVRRAGERPAALFEDARAHILAAERAAQLGVEAVDDGAARSRRRHH